MGVTGKLVGSPTWHPYTPHHGHYLNISGISIYTTYMISIDNLGGFRSLPFIPLHVEKESSKVMKS